MAENLQTIEETETRTSRARPLLRKALAVVGLAATFGSASPAVTAVASSASGAHEAAAHKAPQHKKAVAETPIQKALKSDLANFAGQIITIFNNGKSSPQIQAFAHNAACYGSSGNGYAVGPGQEYFCVDVPITGTPTKGPVAGVYFLTASLDYPAKLLNNPPSTPNPSYVSHVSLQEEAPPVLNPGVAGFYNFEADTDFNSATATNPNAGCVVQTIGSSNTDASGYTNSYTYLDNWEYETAPSTLCDKLGKQAARFTMAELQAEVGIMKTMLNNAAQYAETPVSLALASSLPPPTGTGPDG